jgi:diguanylate cyclase (GGDEF)-like protein
VQSRPKVLVVDDSPIAIEKLSAALAQEGYEVVTAQDGREAIRRVRAEPPDLIILDVVMPDMDGIEVLRVLKARAAEEFIPVMLLSVKSDLESRVSGLRIGADDYLPKPFADEELLARAAALLRIKSLQDTLTKAKRDLERLSVTDGLTGLYNHRFLQERLREEFRRAQRYSDPLSLVMLDLDHFKRVNDLHGHPYGDRVLKQAADKIRKSVREPDICARYGGEEFAVILPKTHLSGALTVGERIWRALGEHVYEDKGTEERLTASLGIAFFPAKDVTSAELLLRCADEALYRAKRDGRNTICLFQAQAYVYDVAGSAG